MKCWLLLLIAATVAQAADFCNPAGLTGPYAFQLSGKTTISGSAQPAVSLGRIVFDGNGSLSGTSSVTFSGLLLGNPVTGTYEVQQDCSITWQLQDDSGAYQHFAGKFTPDLLRANFRQTDTGGVLGLLEKMPDSCNAATLQHNYSYNVSGSIKAMQPDQVAHNVSARGTIDTIREGSFEVDPDCTVHFQLTPANEPQPLNMRGFLANSGKDILAFQTDPGAMVSAHLTTH